MAINTVINTACPECGKALPVAADARVSSIVICAECGVELEVLSVEPLELALAPEIEEDFGE